MYGYVSVWFIVSLLLVITLHYCMGNGAMITPWHSFIHSGYFYSASSSPLLSRGAPDIAWILCQSFMAKRHMQLRMKDLPKVLTWRLEPDSNPRPFGRKAWTLPMGHHGIKSVALSGNRE